MAQACSHCGYNNQDGANFCEGCGQALPTPAAAEPASFSAPPPAPSADVPQPAAVPPPPPPPAPPEFGGGYSGGGGGGYGGSSGSFHPRPANIGWFGEAWNIFTADIGGYLGYFIVMALIMFVVLGLVFGLLTVLGIAGASGGDLEAFFEGRSRGGNPFAQQGANAIMQVVSSIIYGVLGVGIASALLRKLRFGDPLDIMQTFQDGSSRLVQAALFSFIIGIIYSCGLYLCIIPGLWLYNAYVLGMFRLADGAPDFWTAFTDGLEVIKADIGGYILFGFIASLLLPILGACACLIGLLVVYPVIMIAYALAYRASFD